MFDQKTEYQRIEHIRLLPEDSMSGVGNDGEFTVGDGIGDDLSVFARFEDVFLADDDECGRSDAGQVGCEIEVGETKQQFEESIKIQAFVACPGLFQ